jgi:YhcH/YjgK/YiaL family protein
MIIDSLQNAERYYSVHPLFKQAFTYILNTDWDQVEPSKFDIDVDQLKGIVSNKPGMTAAESTAKFECHNQHIDIQLCLSGHETLGWKPRQSCTQPKGEYNPEKDVLFYADAPDMYFQLQPGQFAIFFPEDVHAPMIGEGEIKKLVVKVKHR